ncbi:hypothetical protein PMZ80_010593 [Knufia obscura]|uniref:Major facilitator superfamily (MFS) profile domain-containing protein n=1 Tax=Knufia obscura TaxID=1635080 RepID=A0ABR0R9U8_9EURO|nr:hypothetical protein PMZ80_010593 [Knufia obscura]
MEMNYDEKTLHQLEEELDTKIYPGTEIMSDVGSHHFVKAGEGSGNVLVPQPSNDPHDPLNWNPFWKTSAISLSTAVSFAQGFGPLALAPMFPQLMEAFDASLADVVQFTGVCILVLGFSNFIWVPIQTAFGRRPVLIFSTIICLASNIWRAVAKDYASFMGACILNAQTAQPQIIADVMFLHERGRWNTLYFTFYFGSLMVGPIVSGPMAEHLGQRSFWWFNVGLHGVVLIGLIFLFPETKWHRTHPRELLGQASISTEVQTEATTGKDTLSSKTEQKEKDTPNNDTILPTLTNTTTTNPLAHATTADRDPHLHRGTPSRSQFALFVPNAHPLRTIILDLWIPIKLHIYPIIEFSAFVVSWSASSFLTLNLTQSQAFAVPPYNYTSQTIGFFNFAILAGAIIGLASNGWLSDWFAARLTKRNRGVREPEMRLPTFIPFVALMLLGNFVVAFGYQYKWPWEAIVLIGYTCAGIQVAAIPAIVTTYAVDSYKPVTGSIMVTITVNKNVWGYGFSKFITPWVEEAGFVPPIMLNMCLIFLWCSFGVVFFVWGKKLRGVTRESDVHDM